MPATELLMTDRRRRIGIAALGCLIIAALGAFFATNDSAWPSAFMRIGIVLGSLWLCLPKSNRPAAWSSPTRGKLAIIILIAIVIPRIKFLLPVVAAGGFLLWLSRPKIRRR